MTLTGSLSLNSVFAPVWLSETVRLRKIIASKLITVDTYCQRRRSLAGTLVSEIRFVRIFGRILYKEEVKGRGRALTRLLNIFSWLSKAIA